MAEQQWRTITFDDLRDMTQAERRLCRVRIGDVVRGVHALDNDGAIWTQRKGFTRHWTEYELEHWDAVIEAPQPPPRPLPTHEGAVILVEGRAVYKWAASVWFQPGDHVAYSTEEVQTLADKYGWVELVPAVGPDAEDGRSAGIREVADMFEQYGHTYADAMIRKHFPEAFSDAVNPKENDDE